MFSNQQSLTTTASNSQSLIQINTNQLCRSITNHWSPFYHINQSLITIVSQWSISDYRCCFQMINHCHHCSQTANHWSEFFLTNNWPPLPPNDQLLMSPNGRLLVMVEILSSLCNILIMLMNEYAIKSMTSSLQFCERAYVSLNIFGNAVRFF